MSGATPEPVPTSENGKSRKPKDTPFRQQQLKAVRPILTAVNVMPLFLAAGIIFIPIGIGMYVASNDTKELEIDYTNCESLESPGQPCHEVVNINNTLNSSPNCTCEITTKSTIGTGWTPDVRLYYGITNFFQNHRSYVRSRDDNQLLGVLKANVSDDCKPFHGIDGKNYIPCGAIANSLFNDEIKLSYYSTSAKDWVDVDLIRTGIAWDADKKYKFKNPHLKTNSTEALRQAFMDAHYTRPKNWRKDIWELDPENLENNGLQNEDLMVWMRTAALPDFRKLYRKINHTGELETQLPDTKLKFTIKYLFDVKSFSGTKSVILANTSVLGGKNPFLGIAYIVVGCICLAIAAVCLYVHIKYGKSMMSEVML